MPASYAAPTLGPVLHHDWTRRFFSRLPGRVDWEELLAAPFLYPGTRLEFLARSPGGLAEALVAVRHPRPGPSDRKLVLWHGGRRLVEETLQGWFGAHVQRLSAASCRLLLERVDHFAVADPAGRPTVVLSLHGFAALGASHGVLESLLDARVVVATDGLYARAGHVTSLRVFVEYDGARYGAGARKLFYNDRGDAVVVETVARDVLRRLGYDAVHPAVFHRFYRALAGRTPTHFTPDAWPGAFVAGRAGPLEWARRGLAALEAARRTGAREALVAALEALGRGRAFARHPPAPGVLPTVGRFLSRERFDSFLDSLGDRRLLAILEGLLLGYDCTSADWFAWSPGSPRAFHCEIKSRGDQLRETQKETILWCQRSGLVDYRLLEVLHNAPAATSQPL